jgi:hypothetical protein
MSKICDLFLVKPIIGFMKTHLLITPGLSDWKVLQALYIRLLFLFVWGRERGDRSHYVAQASHKLSNLATSVC